jgi:succinyl-CoA synthetase beta subunit
MRPPRPWARSPAPTSTKDCSLAEINPFILTKDGKVYALDAKINFDDSALYRHKELLELRDLNEEDPLEVEASLRHQLHQAGRHGRLHGEWRGPGDGHHGHHQVRRRKSREFLDVGGGASAEQVKNAFRILLSDPHVKAVLINIFGGILRCDTLATRRGGGGARSEHRGAHRGAHGRHQRGLGPPDSARFRV